MKQLLDIYIYAWLFVVFGVIVVGVGHLFAKRHTNKIKGALTMAINHGRAVGFVFYVTEHGKTSEHSAANL